MPTALQFIPAAHNLVLFKRNAISTAERNPGIGRLLRLFLNRQAQPVANPRRSTARSLYEIAAMSDRAFMITSRQLEYVAACLRRMEEARNRLKATTSEHLKVCDELSKCTTSMYKLLSHLPVIPK